MTIGKILSVAAVGIAMGLIGMATIASAQTYFEDNFDNPGESANKWVDIWGQWEFADGEYHQTMNDVNCMSLVSDDFWDDNWSDYTFELKGLKTGGAEGFLIMFRCMGLMLPRDRILRDHPPRMDGQPDLEYWWNIGGWGNTRSCVERWINGARVEQIITAHSVPMDEWHDIKIVNTATGYTLYFNDEEVGSIDDDTEGGRGRVGLATWSTTARFDEVVVYGSDGIKAVDADGKVATTWAHIKSDLE